MDRSKDSGGKQSEGPVHVISMKRLKDFWENPRHPEAEKALRWWYQQVRHALWNTPADVKATFNTADQVGRKMIFDVGGNKYRIIAVIDYEGHKVFIRFVLDHHEYDRGYWKKDTFGATWKKREAAPADAGSRDRQRGQPKARQPGHKRK
jgi:mRNA interferase HigB